MFRCSALTAVARRAILTGPRTHSIERYAPDADSGHIASTVGHERQLRNRPRRVTPTERLVLYRLVSPIATVDDLRVERAVSHSDLHFSVRRVDERSRILVERH